MSRHSIPRRRVTARRYYGEIPEELPLLALEPATADLRVVASETGLSAASTVVAPNALVVDRGLRAPYHDEWTLGATREIAAETALTLRFVQRRYQRQPRYFHLNYDERGDGSVGLLNPYWGDVVEVRSAGRAEHEAVVVELTRRRYRLGAARLLHALLDPRRRGRLRPPVRGRGRATRAGLGRAV